MSITACEAVYRNLDLQQLHTVVARLEGTVADLKCSRARKHIVDSYRESLEAARAEIERRGRLR